MERWDGYDWALSRSHVAYTVEAPGGVSFRLIQLGSFRPLHRALPNLQPDILHVFASRILPSKRGSMLWAWCGS